MCFFLNAVSFVAVIASLYLIKVAPVKHENHRYSFAGQIKDGFQYIAGFAPIKVILLLLALVSLVSGGLQTLMPVFARDIFMGGPKILGYLVAGSGLGALVGAIYLAGRKSVLGLGRVIAWGSGLFAVALTVFSYSTAFWLSMVLVLLAGFGMMVQMAASNTVLQVIVDEDKRGRIMSFYTMAFMGMSPLGSLLAGWLSGKLTAEGTMALGGVVCLAGAFLFFRQLPMLRAKIRPIYAQKGIIPQVEE
jgi:MFS family permease